MGYGDFYSKTDEGKTFTIFYIIVGVAIIQSFRNSIYLHYEEEKEKPNPEM